MALLGASATGGQSSSAGGGTAGNNDVATGTGAKTINIGGNPNVSAVAQSPLLIAGLVVALVAGAWFFSRRRK